MGVAPLWTCVTVEENSGNPEGAWNTTEIGTMSVKNVHRYNVFKCFL